MGNEDDAFRRIGLANFNTDRSPAEIRQPTDAVMSSSRDTIVLLVNDVTAFSSDVIVSPGDVISLCKGEPGLSGRGGRMEVRRLHRMEATSYGGEPATSYIVEVGQVYRVEVRCAGC